MTDMRLVLIEASLFERLGRVEWGEPDAEGVYTPSVYAVAPPEPTLTEKAVADPDQATWSCVITGPYAGLPLTADVPMRAAVRRGYIEATGVTPTDIWSGWNGAAREEAT